MRKLNTIPGYYQVSDCYVITNDGKLINSKTNRQVKVKDAGHGWSTRICLSTGKNVFTGKPTNSSFSARELQSIIYKYSSWGEI